MNFDRVKWRILNRSERLCVFFIVRHDGKNASNVDSLKDFPLFIAFDDIFDVGGNSRTRYRRYGALLQMHLTSALQFRLPRERAFNSPYKRTTYFRYWFSASSGLLSAPPLLIVYEIRSTCTYIQACTHGSFYNRFFAKKLTTCTLHLLIMQLFKFHFREPRWCTWYYTAKSCVTTWLDGFC